VRPFTGWPVGWCAGWLGLPGRLADGLAGGGTGCVGAE